MAGTTKSFTVKIGADTKDFINGFRQVDKSINETEKQATSLQKSLQIKFDETKLVKAQKLAQDALNETDNKAKSVKERLKLLESTGRINTLDYEKLQTELTKAETKSVRLAIQLEDLNKIKIEKLPKQFSELGNKISNVGQKLAPLSLAFGGALVGSIALAKNAIKTGDDVATMSSKFDMSTKSIQKWQYVAKQTDTSTDALFKGVVKVRSAISQMLTGQINNSTKAIQDLNINVKDFKTSEDAFTGIIEALSKIENKSIQAYYANEIFGNGLGTELIPLLQSGSNAVNGFIKEFENIGYLSDEQVNKLSKLDEEINKVNARFEQAKLQLAIALLPVLEYFVSLLETYIIPAIKSLSEWFNSLSKPVKDTITTMMLLITILSPVLIIVGKLIKSIGVIIPLFAKLKSLSFATASGFLALGGALALGLNIIGNWKQMSTLEKILSALSIAALTAAAAITVFHASWSLGLAIGAITAAIIVGIAAINSAKKDIGIDMNDLSYSGGNLSGVETDYTKNDYVMPEKYNNYDGSQTTNYGEVTNNFYINGTNLSAEEIADEVNKKLLQQKLAYR